MNSIKLIYFITGLIIGIITTFLIMKFVVNPKTNSATKINEVISPKETIIQNCNETILRESFKDYADFYINNDKFYVLLGKINVQDLGNCTFHIKYVRQSRNYSDIQHTNYIKATFLGDKISFEQIQ